MRNHLLRLNEELSDTGRTAIERYLRQSYLRGRVLAWPSQIRGIERLLTNESFALCTPTGSGKTTVAELAILQNLFSQTNVGELSNTAPLALYLVPSRALATEVEANLSRVMRNSAPPTQQVVVTGLYGGTDWGPTDAWLTPVTERYSSAPMKKLKLS
jgi:reverse gyrase